MLFVQTSKTNDSLLVGKILKDAVLDYDVRLVSNIHQGVSCGNTP